MCFSGWSALPETALSIRFLNFIFFHLWSEFAIQITFFFLIDIIYFFTFLFYFYFIFILFYFVIIWWIVHLFITPNFKSLYSLLPSSKNSTSIRCARLVFNTSSSALWFSPANAKALTVAVSGKSEQWLYASKHASRAARGKTELLVHAANSRWANESDKKALESPSSESAVSGNDFTPADESFELQLHRAGVFLWLQRSDNWFFNPLLLVILAKKIIQQLLLLSSSSLLLLLKPFYWNRNSQIVQLSNKSRNKKIKTFFFSLFFSKIKKTFEEHPTWYALLHHNWCTNVDSVINWTIY